MAEGNGGTVSCEGESLRRRGEIEAEGVKMMKGGKWKDRIVGDYNWRFLCMPTPPWKHDRPMPPFFGHNEKLSVLVATVMGLQHALAMASSRNFSCSTSK